MNTLRSILVLIIIALSFSFCNQPQKNKSSTSDHSLKPVYREASKYDSTVYEEAFNKLRAGDSLSKTLIDSFSSDLTTRADFYRLLAELGREEIFPRQYYSFEKAGESILTNWLLYPTELDTIPSKIELLKKVAYVENDTAFTYYVYRFKTDPPHWASKDGWMMGAVGPYFKDSKPYDWANGTFSRLSKLNEITPEKEVEWIHQNIYRKSPGNE